MIPTHLTRGPRPAAWALALAVFAASCGGSATPEQCTEQGYSLLGKSDWKAAQAEFDKALSGMQTTDAGYLRAKMGRIEALIYTEPSRAKDEFLELASATPSPVKGSDYRMVSAKLAGESAFGESIKVLEAGLKAHPDDQKIREQGERIKELASKAGDDEALAALKGLGYL